MNFRTTYFIFGCVITLQACFMQAGLPKLARFLDRSKIGNFAVIKSALAQSQLKTSLNRIKPTHAQLIKKPMKQNSVGWFLAGAAIVAGITWAWNRATSSSSSRSGNQSHVDNYFESMEKATRAIRSGNEKAASDHLDSALWSLVRHNGSQEKRK